MEGPGLRFALNARPTASQGFAAAGTLQETIREWIQEEDQEEASARADGTKARWGQMRASKGAKSG